MANNTIQKTTQSENIADYIKAGQKAMDEGKPREAIRQYSIAAFLAEQNNGIPYVAEAFVGIAKAELSYVSEGNGNNNQHIVQAQKYATLALNIDPNSSGAHGVLAKTQLQLGLRGEAQQQLKQEYLLNPENIEVREDIKNFFTGIDSSDIDKINKDIADRVLNNKRRL